MDDRGGRRISGGLPLVLWRPAQTGYLSRSCPALSAHSNMEMVVGRGFRRRPSEQPQRFGLLLVRSFLVRCGLLRCPLAAALAPGRGSRTLESGIPGFVLPPGPGPFDHRRDLLRQPGQVRVIEGLDMRVRLEGRCTPMVARSPLMDKTTFSSSGAPVCSSTPSGLWRSCSVSSLKSSSPATAAASWSGPSPKRLSATLKASGRVVSVPISSGMVSTLLCDCPAVFTLADRRDAIAALDRRLISPMVSGCQYRSRSTAGTPPNTVTSANSVRSKYPSSTSKPSTRPKHSPVSASHSVIY